MADTEFHRPIAEFSDEELREYAFEHVRYEIVHFVRAAQAVDAARAGLFPMNFALEVFALHVRNLLDFFSPRDPTRIRKTDAWAKVFYPAWEPTDLNLYLRDARWRADKHIAHLTTDRTADVDLKSWAVEPIIYSLIPIIEAFADGAEFVCDEFRREVDWILREAPPRRDWTEHPPQPDTATS